tara:strand:+ start:712 stop:855 length:144 start_codon:yes stop_codon:yes gene_type:complete
MDLGAISMASWPRELPPRAYTNKVQPVYKTTLKKEQPKKPPEKPKRK